MKILITAIGSMSAATVISSLKENNIIVYGCDIYPKEWHPLNKDLEKLYQVPKASHENYVNSLLNICDSEQINFIFPLTDVEIDVLSLHIKKFKSINTIICYPGKKAITFSRDKLNFYSFFKSSSILKVIPTFTFEDLLEKKLFSPVIAKPRKGRSSEGIFFADTLEQIQFMNITEKDYIFQPIVKGNVYTVDYIRDSFKNDFSVAREELIRTTNGAGLTVKVKEKEILALMMSEIGSQLNVIGCINAEFIFNEGIFYLIDINPRFSAGLGFSLLAGYDFTIEHLNVFLGKEITLPAFIKSGIYAKKYIDLDIS